MELQEQGGLVFWKICGVLLFKKSSTVATGILYGGALLALDILLGIFSLKVWRQWNSSLPLLLGQAALLWHFSGSIFITILCSQDFCIWSEFRSLKLSSSDLHIVQLIWINNLTDSVFQ